MRLDLFAQPGYKYIQATRCRSSIIQSDIEANSEAKCEISVRVQF